MNYISFNVSRLQTKADGVPRQYHFFRTEPTIMSIEAARDIAIELRKRFPESDGFDINAHITPNKGIVADFNEFMSIQEVKTDMITF